MPEPITAQVVLRSGRTVFVTVRYSELQGYLKCKVLSDTRNIWNTTTEEFFVNTHRADGPVDGDAGDAAHLHAAVTVLARAVGLIPQTPPRVPQRNFTYNTSTTSYWVNQMRYTYDWSR